MIELEGNYQSQTYKEKTVEMLNKRKDMLENLGATAFINLNQNI